MWLAATRVSTAPGSTRSRSTGSPVATTASARVVGMPSACIASPISASRSIGPTAALPSPPRENGRAARALQGDVATLAGAVDQLAEQHRAAVAELRREAAELVAGVGLRDRLGAFGQAVAGEQRGPASPASAAASRPSSAASGALKNRAARRRCRFRAPGHGEALELAAVGVLEMQQTSGHGRRP